MNNGITLAKEVRLRLGMRQVEFGELFGAHRHTVGRWESGHTLPSGADYSLLMVLARATDRHGGPMVGQNLRDLAPMQVMLTACRLASGDP